MKFKSDLIKNILCNENSVIENTIRSIEPNEKVVLAQGYGAAEYVPRRFLAYVIPLLRLASQLSSNTTIELYFATQGVYRANGKYYEKSLSIMRQELFWFINEYYPNLANRVKILEDVPLSENTLCMINSLFPFAKKVRETYPQIKQFILNRGGDNALRYMLEHLLYMRDPICLNGIPNTKLLVPGMSTIFDHIIMVGGPAEKIFWQFRQAIQKECGTHSLWKSHQFFTQIGDPPTYHVHKGEPVIDGTSLDYNLLRWLKQLPSEYGKQKNLVRDYSVLLQEFARVDMFKLPHEIDPIVLKNGDEVFKRYSASTY